MNRQCPFAIDALGGDVHAEAARVREQGPATRVLLPGGVSAWAVGRSADMRRLLVDPRVSKDAYRHWPAWISGEVGEQWPLAIWVSVQNMITAYGSEHARLRRPAAAAFTARRAAGLRPRIEEVVGELLEDLAASAPGGAVDLRTRFAHELPTRIVFELFGIPEHSWGPLHKIINAFFDTGITAEEAQRNAADLDVVMADLVAHRRRHPGDDMTSALIAARDTTTDPRTATDARTATATATAAADAGAGAGAEGAGAGLSEKELVDSLILLFTAGYETSVNLICTALHELLRNPAQLALVRAGLASWEDVVEEALRIEPPAFYGLLRFAVEDIDMGEGVVIGQGDPILISFGSAGRDPEVHGADADRFDVLRATRGQHLSFGFGTHHCLGATLARLECAVAVRRFFETFPAASLAGVGELGRVESFISNGLRELPVVLGPRAPVAD
ncbi:cytochrome P450 family protein [Streptomyces sp. WM6368]|uniref:cytochrome P450 family protein n=1 Tax=Streptomyces sp. WM6368 TaxID=1415554 RepID=UPI0006AF2B86|nr:cytochrome P450 [Streptomyces sp. WM6368]KOU34878.1 cytochrome P450 [Streptomyces sp. WM6368]